jgi:hypothetical protein
MLKIVSSENEQIFDQLQIVVMDCAYNSFSNPLTQKLFGKYISLKLDGFLKEYGHGVLPLGSYDFIGTVVMVCEKKGEEMEPITCFKSSTLERARYFSLPLEINSLFHSSAEKQHQKFVESLIRRVEQENKSLGYVSSWTMSSTWGKGTPLRKLALQITNSSLVNLYIDSKIDEALSAGILKFKIDDVQRFLGFNQIQFEGEVLPPIEAWFVKNEKTALMHLESFSDAAKKQAKQYRDLWDSRLFLGVNEFEVGTRVAA